MTRSKGKPFGASLSFWLFARGPGEENSASNSRSEKFFSKNAEKGIDK
jgi:hypothetical protein